MVQLTQKEQMLLKDMKSHEEWCIKKYTASAEKAQDPALKQMFSQIAQAERSHLNSLNQIMSGQVPSVGQGGQQAQSSGNMQQAQGGTQQQYQFEIGTQGTTQTQSPKPNPFTKRAQTQNRAAQTNVQNQTVNQTMSSGQAQQTGQTMTAGRPQVTQSQQPVGQPWAQQQATQVASGQQTQTGAQIDIDLCIDLLNTEKYVSSAYNTAIFEFNDSNIRQVLNHIQKEEQQHGEQVYNYLKQHGGYPTQG